MGSYVFCSGLVCFCLGCLTARGNACVPWFAFVPAWVCGQPVAMLVCPDNLGRATGHVICKLPRITRR